MRMIFSCLLAVVFLASGGQKALAATMHQDSARPAWVVEGYMFELADGGVGPAKFSKVTITGRAPDGYSLLVNGPEILLHEGNTFVFDDPVSFFYLRFVNPLRRGGLAEGGIPAQAFLTTLPDEPTSVIVTPSLRDYAPDATLPLPGSAWGLLVGLGALVALRRSRCA